MNPESILKADLLDIVFENRNKVYGAYELRKSYNGRLRRALLSTFGGIGIFMLIAFAWPKQKRATISLDNNELVFQQVEIPKDIKEKPKPKEIIKPKETVMQNAQKFTKMEITNKVEEVKPIQTLKEDFAISTMNSIGEKPIIQKPIVQHADTGTAEVKVVVEHPKQDVVQDVAEIMPEFPGGKSAFYKYMSRNLTAPEELEEGSQIQVIVKFTVSYTGELTNYQIIKDGGDIYNREVLRVLKKMPKWIPGRSNGQNVSVYYTLPVTFNTGQ